MLLKMAYCSEHEFDKIQIYFEQVRHVIDSKMFTRLTSGCDTRKRLWPVGQSGSDEVARSSLHAGKWTTSMGSFGSLDRRHRVDESGLETIDADAVLSSSVV